MKTSTDQPQNGNSGEVVELETQRGRLSCKREPDPLALSRQELIEYLHTHPTVSLWPFTGRALGLSRSLTYRCEQIKVLKLGHRKLVSSSWLERLLFEEG